MATQIVFADPPYREAGALTEQLAGELELLAPTRFQGILAINMPMAQLSVIPAKIKPAPTNPERPIQ